MNADDVSPLAVAVLSLLDERDMHPYEMIQTLRQRKEDQWVKLSTGSLYHQIDRLVACELVRPVGTEKDGNRPPRTIFSMTPDGGVVLRSWVAAHLERLENPYLAFSLALGELASLELRTPSRRSRPGARRSTSSCRMPARASTSRRPMAPNASGCSPTNIGWHC